MLDQRMDEQEVVRSCGIKRIPSAQYEQTGVVVVHVCSRIGPQESSSAYGRGSRRGTRITAELVLCPVHCRCRGRAGRGYRSSGIGRGLGSSGTGRG